MKGFFLQRFSWIGSDLEPNSSPQNWHARYDGGGMLLQRATDATHTQKRVDRSLTDKDRDKDSVGVRMPPHPIRRRLLGGEPAWVVFNQPGPREAHARKKYICIAFKEF